MTFAFPLAERGVSNAHLVVDLQTINSFSVNGVAYELCGVVYSLEGHFVAEVKRGNTFYGYDDQNGARLLPSHASGSTPCFSVSTRNHGTLLLHDRIAALYYVKKSR
jgi:ubiquitin C-terminal hydrolase